MIRPRPTRPWARRVIVPALCLAAFGCDVLGDDRSAPTGIGDPCTPEAEYAPGGGGAVVTDRSVDLSSTSCDSRVCLSLYFQGRVTCPYGNGGHAGQAGPCLAVAAHPGLYTLDGTREGEPCCPVAGDPQQTTVQLPVRAQCSGRAASDAVFCSCRCDVPAGVDRSTVRLCACPDGFSCAPVFDDPALPLAGRGSYCVRDGAKGADLVAADDVEVAVTKACGSERAP